MFLWFLILIAIKDFVGFDKFIPVGGSAGCCRLILAHPSYGSWPHRRELHRKGPAGGSAWRPRPIVAHPSRRSWPHRELNRKPQSVDPHGAAASLWRSPHTVRASNGELHRRPQLKGPPPPPHFGAPFI
eukprot:8635266-Pyramimonas_sp.AAC.1